MKLRYQALDSRGQMHASVLDVATETDAAEQLRRQGLYITRLQRVGDAEGGWIDRARQHLLVRRASRRDLVVFTRQMAMLLGAGTALVPALSAVRSEMRGQLWGEGLDCIRDEVEGGATLATAMSKQPNLFNGVFRSVVAAGEATASLPEMFNRLAALARQELEIRNRVIGGLTYPAVLVVVCAAVVGVLMGFVLPRFSTLFTELHVELPQTTIVMLELSRLARQYWAGGLVAAISLTVACSVFLRSETGRRHISAFLLSCPGISPIVRHLVLARVCRILGLTIQSRVPLLEAIGLTTEATGHQAYRDLLKRVADHVSRGESMAQAMDDSPLVPQTLVQAVAAGETSGNIGTALSFVADCYDEDNRHRIGMLSRIVEPLILVVLGLFVGAVALSLFVPLFDLATVAGG